MNFLIMIVALVVLHLVSGQGQKDDSFRTDIFDESSGPIEDADATAAGRKLAGAID